LRPFEAADINATYLGWLNDPEVTRYSNQRFHQHTPESCAANLESGPEPNGAQGPLAASIRKLIAGEQV
jgi:hypothetical protein